MKLTLNYGCRSDGESQSGDACCHLGSQQDCQGPAERFLQGEVENPFNGLLKCNVHRGTVGDTKKDTWYLCR